MTTFSLWTKKEEKTPYRAEGHQEIGIGYELFPIEFRFASKNNENGLTLQLSASDVRFLVRKLKLIKERYPKWLVETEDERKHWTPENVFGPAPKDNEIAKPSNALKFLIKKPPKTNEEENTRYPKREGAWFYSNRIEEEIKEVHGVIKDVELEKSGCQSLVVSLCLYIKREDGFEAFWEFAAMEDIQELFDNAKVKEMTELIGVPVMCYVGKGKTVGMKVNENLIVNRERENERKNRNRIG